MDQTQTRILFVDDEPQVLSVLGLMLKPLQAELAVDFVTSGAEALALMAEKPFDVVVSDMRMPGMTGAELLNEVMLRYPQMVRIILSGFADQELVMRCVGSTHLYLTKPITATALRSTLKRIRELNQRLMKGEICKLVTRMSCLPSMPSIYFKIMNALQSPNASVQTIAAILEQDPALTAKILQLSNSAFFGSAASVTTAVDAVQFLGVQVVASLAMANGVFSSFDNHSHKKLALDELWQHTIHTAFLARAICRQETHDLTQSETAFTAGILHDIGKLVVAANLPKQYLQVLNRSNSEQRPAFQIESEIFNVDHAEVGGYLLGLWGLPVTLVEAVGLHHHPEAALENAFSPLTAVHAANVLEQQKCHGETNPCVSPLNLEYLNRLRLADRIADWRTLV
jgi:putative nucleotidyltransferase with HDIG domain